MWIKSTLLLAIALASVTAHGEIYKWTDEKGQVHYDSSVAKSKKDSAEKVNPKSVSILNSSQSETAMRYVPNPREQDNKPADPAAAAPDSTPADNGNAAAGNKNSKCEEEWRKYRESQACFAPYMVGGHGVRGEAFQHCTSVSQPALCN